jgi:hypothetical protein
MLRIETELDGDNCTLALHGSLAGEWVPLLERHWRGVVDQAPSATVTAVLTDVSFIDRDGERLLERMWRRGVEMVASGCMNRHVIDSVRRRCER